jgi:hypothetical protein
MSRGGNDEHVRDHLRVAVNNLVTSTVELNRSRNRVVDGPRILKLDSLSDDRSIGEEGIAATMVEVKMRVDDVSHIVQVDAQLAERFVRSAAARPIVFCRFGVCLRKPRVEQDYSV